jgi:hypothetical protein
MIFAKNATPGKSAGPSAHPAHRDSGQVGNRAEAGLEEPAADAVFLPPKEAFQPSSPLGPSSASAAGTIVTTLWGMAGSAIGSVGTYPLAVLELTSFS